MLTYGRNLIFFLVCGSTMGAMARHSVLNILYSEGRLDMLLANGSFTRQWLVLFRTCTCGWLPWLHDQILWGDQIERADNALASQQACACTMGQTNCHICNVKTLSSSKTRSIDIRCHTCNWHNAVSLLYIPWSIDD